MSKSENRVKSKKEKGKILNSLKISLSVIGSVVGAGFITGREILTFFSAYNPIAVSLTLFACFFLLITFLLEVKNKKTEAALKKGNFAVYFLSFFIISSMLGATDSLFFSVFKLPKSVPLGSLMLICAATAVCFGGISKIEKANVVIVPFMLVVAAYIAFGRIFSRNFFVAPFSLCGVFGFSGIYGCFSYCSMNVGLAQPFFCKIKSENKNFSPVVTALSSAFCLSVLVFVYLIALKNSVGESADIPILCLADSPLAKYLAAASIFGGIITTQFSAEYPLVSALKKRKKGGLCIALLAVFSFVFSRLGFYVIVDVVYPAIGFISLVYYAVVIVFAALPFFRARLRRHTSARQARLKATSKS